MSSYGAASTLTDYDVRGCAQLVGMSVGQVVVRHVGMLRPTSASVLIRSG